MTQVITTDSAEQVTMSNAKLQGMLQSARREGYAEGLVASLGDDDVVMLAECFDTLVRDHGVHLSALFDDAHRHAIIHTVCRANDIQAARAAKEIPQDDE